MLHEVTLVVLMSNSFLSETFVIIFVHTDPFILMYKCNSSKIHGLVLVIQLEDKVQSK